MNNTLTNEELDLLYGKLESAWLALVEETIDRDTLVEHILHQRYQADPHANTEQYLMWLAGLSDSSLRDEFHTYYTFEDEVWSELDILDEDQLDAFASNLKDIWNVNWR